MTPTLKFNLHWLTRDLIFLASCSLMRIAQISLRVGGAFCPTSLPLFQGSLVYFYGEKKHENKILWI